MSHFAYYQPRLMLMRSVVCDYQASVTPWQSKLLKGHVYSVYPLPRIPQALLKNICQRKPSFLPPPQKKIVNRNIKSKQMCTVLVGKEIEFRERCWHSLPTML